MSRSEAGPGSTLTHLLVGKLGAVRTDWSLDEVRALFALPFSDLMFAAIRNS